MKVIASQDIQAGEMIVIQYPVIKWWNPFTWFRKPKARPVRLQKTWGDTYIWTGKHDS